MSTIYAILLEIRRIEAITSEYITLDIINKFEQDKNFLKQFPNHFYFSSYSFQLYLKGK